MNAMALEPRQGLPRVILWKVHLAEPEESTQPMSGALSWYAVRPPTMIEARDEGRDYLYDRSLKTPAKALWQHGKDSAALRTSVALQKDSSDKAGKKAENKAMTPNFF